MNTRITTTTPANGILPAKYRDMTGMRVGHLTVLRPTLMHNQLVFECECDCGRHVTRRPDKLRRLLENGTPTHCKHCDGTPRFDWQAVIDANRQWITKQRNTVNRHKPEPQDA